MRAYVWMLAAAVAFAAMAESTYALRKVCPWQVIGLVRASIPLVLTGLMLAAARIPLPFPGPRILWSRSIAGSISLVCTFYALTQLPAADVLTLSNLVPLWVAIFSGPLLGHRPGLDVWASVLVGVIGVALSQQEYVLEGNFASLVAVAASMASAVALVSLHRVKGFDPRAIVFHFSCVSLLVCSVTAFLVPMSLPVQTNHASTWGLLAAVGLSATVGQFFLTKAYMAGHPSRISVVGLSQVAFAMAFDVWVSAQSFSPLRILGLAMVVASTAWVMLSMPDKQVLSEIEGERVGASVSGGPE